MANGFSLRRTARGSMGANRSAHACPSGGSGAPTRSFRKARRGAPKKRRSPRTADGVIVARGGAARDDVWARRSSRPAVHGGAKKDGRPFRCASFGAFGDSLGWDAVDDRFSACITRAALPKRLTQESGPRRMMKVGAVSPENHLLGNDRGGHAFKGAGDDHGSSCICGGSAGDGCGKERAVRDRSPRPLPGPIDSSAVRNGEIADRRVARVLRCFV